MEVSRGAVPSIVCPRCGQSGPPQQTRLVTCAGCGLSFDGTRVPEPSARTHKRLAPGTHGRFRAPSMGYRSAPFPITGPGTCELGDSYLTVSGFRARGGLVRFAAVMGGLGLAIALAIGLDRLGLEDRVVIVAAFAVFLAGALTPLPPSRLQARFRIPYDNIHKVTLVKRGISALQTGTVLIDVRDFAPKGEIHFVTADPAAFARQVLARKA